MTDMGKFDHNMARVVCLKGYDSVFEMIGSYSAMFNFIYIGLCLTGSKQLHDKSQLLMRKGKGKRRGALSTLCLSLSLYWIV